MEIDLSGKTTSQKKILSEFFRNFLGISKVKLFLSYIHSTAIVNAPCVTSEIDFLSALSWLRKKSALLASPKQSHRRQYAGWVPYHK